MHKVAQDTVSSEGIDDITPIQQAMSPDHNQVNAEVVVQEDTHAVTTADEFEQPEEVNEDETRPGTSEHLELVNESIGEASEAAPSVTQLKLNSKPDDEDDMNLARPTPHATLERSAGIKSAKTLASPNTSKQRVLGDWTSTEEDELFDQRVYLVSPDWKGALQLSPGLTPRSLTFPSSRDKEQVGQQEIDVRDDRADDEHVDDREMNDEQEDVEKAGDEQAVDLQSAFSDSESDESNQGSEEAEVNADPASEGFSLQQAIDLDENTLGGTGLVSNYDLTYGDQGELAFDDHFKRYPDFFSYHVLKHIPEIWDTEQDQRRKRGPVPVRRATNTGPPERPFKFTSSPLRLNSENLPVIPEEAVERARPSGRRSYSDGEYERLYTDDARLSDSVHEDYERHESSTDSQAHADDWQEKNKSLERIPATPLTANVESELVMPVPRRPIAVAQVHNDGTMISDFPQLDTSLGDVEGQSVGKVPGAEVSRYLALFPDRHMSLKQHVTTYRRGYHRTQSAPAEGAGNLNRVSAESYLKVRKRLIFNAAGNRREYWSQWRKCSISDFEYNYDIMGLFFEEDARLLQRQKAQEDKALQQLQATLKEIEKLKETNKELRAASSGAHREQAKLRELQMRSADLMREVKTPRDEKDKLEANHQQLIICYEDADEKTAALEQELETLKAHIGEGPLRKSPSTSGDGDEGIIVKKESPITDKPGSPVPALERDIKSKLETQQLLVAEQAREIVELKEANLQLEKRLKESTEEHERGCVKRLEVEWEKHQEDIARLSTDFETKIAGLEAANKAAQVELQGLRLTRASDTMATRGNGPCKDEKSISSQEAQVQLVTGDGKRGSSSSLTSRVTTPTHGAAMTSKDHVQKAKVLYAPRMMHIETKIITTVLTETELKEKTTRRKLELDNLREKHAHERRKREKLLGISRMDCGIDEVSTEHFE